MKEQKTILLHNITVHEFKKEILNEFKEILKSLDLIKDDENNFEYLTRKEVAEILKVSIQTLYEWDKVGILNAYRIGNRVRYKSNELDDALTRIHSRRNY